MVNALIFVEERINSMVEIWGAEGIKEVDVAAEDAADKDKDLLNDPALKNEGISQNYIDALFD